MPTPTDDNRNLLTVIARRRAKPGRDDPAVFFFYENWESEAKLDAHLQTPHLVHFVGIMGDLLDGELVIQKLRRIA